eukprot:TRINITY_DN18589_c0_g1_i4.p1 TRINITY_DN18589_c0_g1~~TRINITY_DN18589_c0_g1_i4.p1  ORF type:complete len:176 (+),score=34.10 TRINITY_DN18589_c0_g1_i4:146-673(+)
MCIRDRSTQSTGKNRDGNGRGGKSEHRVTLGPTAAMTNPGDSVLGKSIQQSGGCVAKPSVVHFGGLKLHRPHRQVCRIMNTSMRTQRFTIHNPTTPYFKARQSKLGTVAPGMWEEVMIEFTPDEHRYYYDSIRVVSQGGDPVVVPIHAYPVVNTCLLYTSPSPRDRTRSRMPSSA